MASQSAAFVAPMGSIGDTYPTFFAATKYFAETPDKNVLFLCQPIFRDRLIGLLENSVFSFSGTNTYTANAAVNTVQYYPFNQETKEPPRVVVDSSDYVRHSFTVEERVFACAQHRGKFVVSSPVKSTRSMDECDYQTVACVEKCAFKKDNFNEFLEVWRGWWASVSDKWELSPLVISNYDRSSNLQLWNLAMGMESYDVLLRHSSLALATQTPCPKEFMALSPTLSPTLEVQSITKHGVISMPADLFQSPNLSDQMESFFRARPTIVVSISSFGFTKLIKQFLDTAFLEEHGINAVFAQTSGSDTAFETHVGFVNLEPYIRRAFLTIHGGGTGTVFQVASCGRTAIGISSTYEQRKNCDALVDLGIGHHFELGKLVQEESEMARLRATVLTCLHGVEAKPRDVAGILAEENGMDKFLAHMRSLLE